MKRIPVIYCLLFTFCISLSGCGFHLRGNTSLTQIMQPLYLQAESPYGPLARYLKRYLVFAGVKLTDTKSTAKTVLVLPNEIKSQQLLSQGGTGQTSQYNVILTAHFSVTTHHDEILLADQVVSEVRQLTMQTNQILAGTNEEQSVALQMRRALVVDILNRLTSQEVVSYLQTTKQ